MTNKRLFTIKNDFMKRVHLFAIIMCMAVTSALAQRTYTFNAVALNVDGLPNKISGIEINPDGKEAAGATELCGILANSGWDFVGFSEDFNFHSQLTAAPASTYYNFGEHGGTISATAILGGAATDGLGFACRKSLTMSGGTRVKWGVYNGFTDQGADGLVTKGFRVYTVTFATGVAVDVYVLHMDADSGEKDIATREEQLKILADYIKNNHNNRPVIVLGDTNCRYTREHLETGFIDYINADSRFTIKDAWIEHMWGGEYPTYGSGSIMTSEYGAQKGEVVDKIFYINTTESNLVLESNSYLHDTSLTTSDHFPVVVNFTLTDPSGKAPTDEEKEDNWTLEGEGDEGNVNQKPTWEGEQVTSGSTYYLMNVGSGKYVKVGASWQTQATSGYAGTPVTVTALSDGKYALQSLGNSRGNYMTAVEYPFMDGTADESHAWVLTPISTSNGYQYYIEGGNGALTVTDEVGNVLKTVAKNASDDKQKWVFLTDARIRIEMAKANADYPFNFTPLLKSADFDKMEHEAGYASVWSGFSFGGVDNGDNAATYNHVAIANSTNAVSVSHSLGTLPGGNYSVSFDGFYRSQYTSWFSTKDETLNAVVSFGGTNIAVKQNTGTDVGAAASTVASLLKGGTYSSSGAIKLGSSSSVTLTVSKPKTSSSAKNAWICIDNFQLEYCGTGEVVSDPYKKYKDQVRSKVNETYEKVLLLNKYGQAAYDISFVIYRYNNNLITSQADADALCALVDKAYANAYAAHLAGIVKEAVENLGANGGDLTSAIVNPSFEMGDLSGWTTFGATTKGVFAGLNGTYATGDCDGEYLFYTSSGDNEYTSYVKQTVRGIPNGLYELKASLTSLGVVDGKSYDYNVYLFGNGYNASVAATQGNGTFHEATLYFLVEDGTATIGAVGAHKSKGDTFIYYYPSTGCCFKADNFRLKYICNLSHGRLKLALDDADNSEFDVYGQECAEQLLADYHAKYENKSLLSSTDGRAEANGVYTKLQEAVRMQRIAGVDMTWAIENPSFETGDYTGWSTTVAWDTGVKPQENETYMIAGTDGRYLFNTWNDAVNATNSGVNAPITQTVKDLPNGLYRLDAMMASDRGNTLRVNANGVESTIVAKGAAYGVFPSVECQVTDGTLTIEAGGVNSCWYKCDDFHLTLVMPAELVLNDTDAVIADIQGVTYPRVKINRTIRAVTEVEEGEVPKPLWSTFVAPFDIPASSLVDWDVMELVGSTKNGNNVSLDFDKATDGIKAGVPYMVRNTTMTSDLTEIIMENVSVNTSFNNSETDHVNFVGTYTDGYVPEGGCFISNNVFYQAGNSNTNRLKGFRAYLEITDPEVRSISYRIIGEEDNTGDDNTGDDNTGDDNTGDDNTGDDNTGDDNTGDDNTGDDNTGDDNTGDDNTGDDNTGDDNDNVEDSVDSSTAVITSIAIYNTAGERLETMQVGLNILLMSDGSIIKVMVKE